MTHYESSTPMGCKVICLNTNSSITQEDACMLQALYSRDPNSVYDHLEKLKNTPSGKFMDTYYVNYGHKSIGDCGIAILFIENVSMLAAKAVQDWALYNGQEVSTRYVDYSKQPFIIPSFLSEVENGKDEFGKIHEKLRNFYISNLPKLCNFLKSKYPIKPEEKVGIYNKAINAKAFDILRGFLPTGASTSLSISCTLRQFADKLMYLRNHPLEEVRQIAASMKEVLQKGNPHSFNHKIYEENEKYVKNFMENNYYFNPTQKFSDFELSNVSLDYSILSEYRHLILGRPPKSELPPILSQCGNLSFEFLLDYGSYRDLQRHRSVSQTMPLLTIKNGFENWYLDQLSEEIKIEALELLKDIEYYINISNIDEKYFQYIIPMGYKVPIRLVGNLPSIIYISELRSSTTVHQTLRIRAIQIAKELQKILGKESINVIDDNEIFDVKRGTQDIIQK